MQNGVKIPKRDTFVILLIRVIAFNQANLTTCVFNT